VFFEFKTGDQVFRINPDPAKLTAAELIAVERNTGLGMIEFAQALQNPAGGAAAISALVWLARRRSGDFVKWADFVETFHPMTLDVEIIADEASAEVEATPVETATEEKPAAPKPRSRSRSRAKTS
jgi:hypothetical protein